ncbi:MAG: hypothetical protein JWQ87_3062 [Candidatus Sulfotelmatobacter sp.]|nr:hypothetical protein [Candidatus Sulfotelmatobacter sp.]
MSAGSKLTGLLVAGMLCLPLVAKADTPTPHRAHKVKKQQSPPPPLPSGAQGPVPQIPLDAIPAVAPTVNYQDGMLTIVAPNSSLGDILRGIRKHTAADIEIPATANERVATRLGPGPAREVMAELLNGSHFNYILLGSPENANQLVRVVLVAKTGPDNPPPPTQTANGAVPPQPVPNAVADAPDSEVVDETSEEAPPDQSATDAEQQQPPPDQPGVKTPQQMLQEMQQRQLQMQQGQQNGQPPMYPPPGGVPSQRPQPPPQEQQ